MSEKSQRTERQASGDSALGGDLIDGVVEAVGAALEVGASLTRSIAKVTAGQRRVPEPSGTGGPIAAIVHYGSAALANVVHTVLGTTDRRHPGDTRPESRTRATRTAAVPTVEPGATLRIPLSIENPGNEPMEGMGFSCLRLVGETAGVGTPLDKRALRFAPRSLTVAPHDFEKLTVFVNTAHDTDPGRYEAVVGLGDDIFEVSVHFDVVPRDVPRREEEAEDEGTQ